MYRAADSPYWGDYTTAALFEFRGTPAVLLYRDDFFIDSEAELPPVQVWGFERENPRPVELSVPAFAALSAGEGWNIETLRQGRDGLWYYRGVKKDEPRGEIRYLRTADLTVAGESCSAGVFRNAAVPYTEDRMPVPLRLALEEAGRRYGVAGTLVAAVVSPDFPIVRYFSAAARTAAGSRSTEGALAAEAALAECAGYYRGSGADAAEPAALAVLPDGRGVLVTGDDSAPRPDLFSLPPLPEGFVYTRIGVAGRALVAAWEEQDDWNVGAAGFLVMKLF
jgi:hypothetical protein